MSRILVWDLPTRLFHWLFTATVVAALAIALLVDDDSTLFQVHMLLGLVAGFMVLLRLVWGFAGSRYARFGSFLFGPKALVEYLAGVFRRNGERHLGHNPGSAYAIYAMLLLALGLALSGLMMPSWKALEELHEVMAYSMLLVAGAHFAGIVLHTLRHRENIALSMVNGRKNGDAAQGIGSSNAIIGIVFLALTAGASAVVVNGHDEGARQLTLFGQAFQLGESEHDRDNDREEDHDRRGKKRDGHGRHDRDDHHEHHDDDD
ncbi:MAG: cytochrome b/b6 domain-containing protein [Polyangiaceae bacterium]|nr:cytochrome b/b6 domain-containing protein [Polyangiaceae bacterium]